MAAPRHIRALAEQELRRRQAQRRIEIPKTAIIPESMTFRQWVDDLAQKGLKVDGHPFTLENRKALWAIYDEIPSTPEQARGQTLILQKGSQMGLTIFEILANLYMAIKFAPCKSLMYLPSRDLASYKSTNRFMPILRSAPNLYRLIAEDGKHEGNVLTRVMTSIQSNFLFLWTSGRDGGVTESFPGDVLSLDECQGMTLEQIDRVRERLSASRIRFTLMLSTPLYPEMDINAHYLRGTQHKFHTRCGCQNGVVLTDLFQRAAITKSGQFPVTWNDGKRFPDAPIDWVYFCPECDEWIPDSQDGEWIAKRPDASITSYHLSQIISPTVTPRELIDAWGAADTIAQRESFFRRKLGTPYIDPSQAPITMDLLRQCVTEGLRLGIGWKKTAKHTILGIDQMGSFSCAIVAERLPNGKMAVIQVEAIYALDPWARLDEMMAAYGVQIAVAEQLPNIDSARQFAKRHEGKVFLITSYGDKEEMVAWGDSPLSKLDRKTAEEYRDRYTVRVDQYRVIDWAFSRLSERYIVFPDPNDLIQDIQDGGIGKPGPVLSEMVFLHFTKTGLVIEEDKEQRKTRRKVIKIGLDPHFSFSLMAVCVGWFRAFGTSTFLMPHDEAPMDKPETETQFPGLPDDVVNIMAEQDQYAASCGACAMFDAERGLCTERNLTVKPGDPECQLFIPG